MGDAAADAHAQVGRHSGGGGRHFVRDWWGSEREQMAAAEDERSG